MPFLAEVLRDQGTKIELRGDDCGNEGRHQALPANMISGMIAHVQ